MTQDETRKPNPFGPTIEIITGLVVVTLAHLVLVSSDKAAWFASRIGELPVEKQPGLVPMIANVITAVPPFAAPYTVSAGCMVAIVAFNARLGWRPSMFARTRTVGGALLMSVLLASLLTGACEFLAGIHERVDGMGEYAYDAGGRIAVFCMVLMAAASCLFCSGLVLDLTRRGDNPAKEIFGHDAFPTRALRMQAWTVLLMLGLIALVSALAWAMAYYPSRMPKDLAPSLLASGLPPLHVPFSWVGDLLGFGRVQTYALSVIISALLVWCAAKVAVPSFTAPRASEPSTAEA